MDLKVELRMYTQMHSDETFQMNFFLFKIYFLFGSTGMTTILSTKQFQKAN